MITVTEEMYVRIKKMMCQTYSQIGCDLPKKMKGTELRDVIADADYMMTYGDDKEAYEFWKTIPRIQQDKILKDVFPNKWYCD